MQPGMGNMFFGTEVIYSFIIIVVSLMIYFSTKELYELSNYKGIKYFRLAFLFFAIAYFFRSFIKFLMFYFGVADIRYFQHNLFFGSLTLLIFAYFSSMAIFYLLQSVLYKKLHEKTIYLFNLISLFFAISVTIFFNPNYHILINLVLLAFIIVTYYFSRNEKKKGNKLSVIYGLLIIFWILNIFDMIVPNFLQNFQILIYLSSISVFLIILYKVLRKIGTN